MFDIFVFLFENYFDAGSFPAPERLAAKLTAAGFEEHDINQAVTWLNGLQQLSLVDYPSIINQTGSRCFAELERQLICVDGLRFISFWEQNNVISPVEREMIIDRALVLGHDNLSLDKVKLITLMVLWNQHEDLDFMLMEDLLTTNNATSVH
jgi:Smg protein